MNTERKLYQWDTGQKLVGCTGLYVDFPIDNEVYRVETADGMCIIPDELLQASGSHKVYECMTNNTIRSFAFSVTPRPKPPDYVYTPTERLTFEGLVQKVDDAVADMIRRAESGEFDGHTPVKGTDYFTASEIQQIQNEVSSGAIGEFKTVVDTETDKFNANAIEKVNTYNQNDSQKTTSYNANATQKLNAYNANANNRVAEFDTHTKQIQTDISELKSDLFELQEVCILDYSIEVVLDNDKYWNTTDVSVGSSFSPVDMGYLSGCKGTKIEVIEGEKYKIKGKGNSGAVKSYVITDADGLVTRVYTDSIIDDTITILNGEKTLYVNLKDFADGDGVTNFKTIKDSVDKLSEDVLNIGTLELSSLESTSDVLLNKSFNFYGVSIGNKFSSATSDVEGNAVQTIVIDDGYTYYINGNANAYAYKQYIILDKKGTIIDIKEEATRGDVSVITPPKNARYILVNFIGYNSETDYVKKKKKLSFTTLNDGIKPLNGKTIVCFGDSITKFNGIYGGSYPFWLSKYSGATVYNVAVAGTRLMVRDTPTETPQNSNVAYAGVDIAYLFKSIVEEDFYTSTSCANWIDANSPQTYSVSETIETLKNIDWSNVDAITIFAGTNDWNNGKALGTPSDTQYTTTLGAINYIIKKFCTKYPNVKVYWFTPMVRWAADNISERTAENWSGVYTTSEGKTLLDYVDAIKNCVSDNCIPVCDLYRTLGVNKYNFSNYFTDTDGTHPYYGFKELGKKVMSFIVANSTI